MLRRLSMAAVLAGAVGVPYAIWNGEDALDFTSGWSSEASEESVEADRPASQFTPTASKQQGFTFRSANTPVYDPTALEPTGYHAPDAAYPDQGAYPQPMATSDATLIALGEVLNLDVTHGWVTQRFPRVTTTLADTKYDGLRVPFVSGTRATDVTGSLTYYFDRQKTLQRITFHGTTGDTSQLVALLVSQLQLEEQDCLGGQLYTRSWLGQTTSVCRIRPAGVLQSDATNGRYEVLLEINRDQWRSKLSKTAAQLVD